MSIELVKKQVDVNTMTRREMTQVVKERDLIVPDGKPDMNRVLSLDGELEINQIEVQEGRIVYKGELVTNILYVSEDGNSGVCTMKGIIPIEDFVVMDDIGPNQKVEFDSRIEHLHWNILNERKLNVKGILEMDVAATEMKEVEILTDINADSKIEHRTNKIEIVKPTSSKTEKVMLKDELTITQDKGSVGEILNTNVSIKEEQIRRTEEEILFNGIVEVTTMYKTLEDASRVDVVTHRIPFAAESVAIKSEEEAYCDCDLSVQLIDIQVAPDYDGEDRILEVEGCVTAEYITYQRMSEEVIDDIYCPGKKIERVEAKQKYVTLKNRMDMNVPNKEVLMIENLLPATNQIFAVKVKATVDDTMVEGGKLKINGMLEFKVVYTSSEGATPIEIYTTMVPFTQELVLATPTPYGDYEVKVVPKEVQVGNLADGELTIDYILKYIVNGYEQEELVTIEGVEVMDMGRDELDAYPSIVVYITKQGDNLWDMAKRFNTTVKDIVEINGIEEKSTLYPGQKIMVLKKVTKN